MNSCWLHLAHDTKQTQKDNQFVKQKGHTLIINIKENNFIIRGVDIPNTRTSLQLSRRMFFFFVILVYKTLTMCWQSASGKWLSLWQQKHMLFLFKDNNYNKYFHMYEMSRNRFEIVVVHKLVVDFITLLILSHTISCYLQYSCKNIVFRVEIILFLWFYY